MTNHELLNEVLNNPDVPREAFLRLLLIEQRRQNNLIERILDEQTAYRAEVTALLTAHSERLDVVERNSIALWIRKNPKAFSGLVVLFFVSLNVWMLYPVRYFVLVGLLKLPAELVSP